MRTPGSVGAPGEQSPGATRPPSATVTQFKRIKTGDHRVAHLFKRHRDRQRSLNDRKSDESPKHPGRWAGLWCVRGQSSWSQRSLQPSQVKRNELRQPTLCPMAKRCSRARSCVPELAMPSRAPRTSSPTLASGQLLGEELILSQGGDQAVRSRELAATEAKAEDRVDGIGR